MKLRILFFLFIIIIAGCGRKTIEKKDLCQFELQRVKKYNYKIYRICINSDFAFTEEIFKTLIFKNGEKFDANGGYELNGNIGEWISEDTLTIYRFDNKFEQPQDTIAKISFEKYGNLNFKIFNYGAINSSSLNEYTFESFELRNNKLHLHGIKRIAGPEMDTNIFLNLGNLKIQTKSDTITKLSYDRIETSMDFTYHNPDGSFTDNLPEIKILTTDFYPKKKTKLSSKNNLDRIFIDIK
ncbi:hypothetical protein [Flavobacterium pallidum]|uniref:Uncharacterized protein n=1 Tax=Flavobacterium pallidum TaxID=2172098 RepID=A0A2S1SKD7_9FLAO|nr:hypothetical protein [Flavobacterium pallidum]AWI26880.1 hypothetical protein HYN49_13745 [Flavobacterium pallidum]